VPPVSNVATGGKASTKPSKTNTREVSYA
jgi:hypothetical protein